jgi:hypothetical protein
MVVPVLDLSLEMCGARFLPKAPVPFECDIDTKHQHYCDSSRTRNQQIMPILVPIKQVTES